MLNERPTIMLGLALILAIAAVLLTSCTSTSLENTCNRFGMDTSRVYVKDTQSETLGETKKVTKFQCVPKKYKVK